MEAEISNQPIVETPQKVDKKNGFLVSLLSVLLLLSCIIAGFFAWQTQNLVKELQEIRSQELVTSVPTPTPDPTADWKTYTNTKYFYTLKYPSHWLAESREPGVDNTPTIYATSRSIILSPDNQIQRVPNPLLEIQSVGSEISRPNYSEWVKRQRSNFVEGYKITNETTYDIAGVSATLLEGLHMYPSSSTYIKQLYFASSEEGVYHSISIGSDTKQDSAVFDQILSTFKFTDLEPVTSPQP